MTTTAIDYHVALDCRIKRRFSLAQLAPIVHADGGPEALLTQYARASDEADDTPHLVRRNPGQAVLESVAVAPVEVARRAEAARKFRRTCRDCPANLDRGRAGFGCFGTIPLPVTELAEQGLMAVIERIMVGDEDVESAAPAPIRFIWDNGLDGQEVGHLRRVDGWFELSEPVVMRVGPFLDKRDVSTDQVLEVFLTRARFAHEYAVLFAAFSSEVARIVQEIGEEVEAAAPIARLFRSIALAADLGVAVQMTPLPREPDIAMQPTVPDLSVTS